MLELRNITKAYTTASLTQVALDNISVAFRDNEFVAILGQSGSGKTTMLNIVGGLDHFDSGDLVIDGISTKDYRDRDWDSYRNNRIGFVFQSYNLIPHQSVLANVELALTLSGVSRKERRARALDALKEVGLSDHIYKRPSQMSGGQMQRVAIARALVNDPEILLADEPTGALDSKTSVQVMDLLRDVAKDRLVIMVTHNPELARQYATRIVELADGQIVADSAPFIPGTETIRQAKAPRKTSMSLLTALSLSANNLMTKKGRTVMTSFAGSIGIIGIAAILALANGANDYIARTEEEALTSYPLTIQKTAMDMEGMLAGPASQDQDDSEQSGETSTDSGTQTKARVKVSKGFTETMNSAKTNDLKTLKSFFDANGGKINDYVETIEYSYNVTPQIYLEDTTKGVVQVSPEQAFATLSSAYGSGAFRGFVSTEAFGQLPASKSLYENKYEVVAGQWPDDADELVLVLDSNGSMQDLFEYALGLRDHAELDKMMEDYYSGQMGTRPGGSQLDASQSAQSGSTADADNAATSSRSRNDSYTYDDILGITYKRINPAEKYVYDDTYKVWTDKSNDLAFIKDKIAHGQNLRITGIVKATDDDVTTLRQGILYTPELTEQMIQEAQSSQIVKEQLDQPQRDVFTGKTFDQLAQEAKEGAQSDFDMTSLFSIDEAKIQAAFQVDPNALQMDLSGLDLSGMDTSALDMSDFQMDLADMDLSGMDLSQAIDPDAFDLSKVNLGDLSQIYPQLAQVDYVTIIQSALADGAVGDTAGEELGRVATQIADGYAAYAATNSDSDGDGTPDVDAAQLVTDYLQTQEVSTLLQNTASSDRVIDSEKLTANLAQALGEDPAIEGIAQTVGQRLATSIGTQIAAQLGSALSSGVSDMISTYMTSAMTSAMSGIMQAVQTQLTSQIETAMAGFAQSMANAMSFDQKAFADAFQVNMDEDDLAALMSTMMRTTVSSYESNLAKLGWGDLNEPNDISIYPTSFEDKDQVKKILDDYSQAKIAAGQNAQAITYTDMVGMLMSSVTRIIDIISWMLIAFVSISLVVSSIMIAIITYISVLERKKEIGVLRSIGASKKDISHVFNAETVIEGLLAGIMGVGITLMLCVIANVIVSQTLGVDNIAQLPVSAAMVLILISVLLTLVAGLLPARKAAREDPVEALRSE
ncbi:ABC transporter ATP-binding protein/permease [Schaalia vaccimaxillae]|uniref:ABC transporter ATP-binding protein/permease n=1 Tax=Schaalia vaccimaxillae TaxID=183916 RepID=UPI0003B4AD11|nr:ABC transporter ATP-binding protein/permease [Schaalia vaccimaxillae]